MKKNFETRFGPLSSTEEAHRTLMVKRILEVVSVAGRGHIGPALSILDILDVLYGRVMRNCSNLNDLSRDRFILSKGHGCLSLYVVLEKYNLIGNNNLETFCQFHSVFGGHPENSGLPHVEFSTGALGHGPSLATGLAMGAKLLNNESRIYVLTGDGELNEGSVWEAAMHAQKHFLNNLCFIVDKNDMQAYGESKEVLNMEPMMEKWKAFGFSVSEVDGHSKNELEEALNFGISDSSTPRIVIAKTIKGKGLKSAENSPAWHHKARISSEDIEELLTGLN